MAGLLNGILGFMGSPGGSLVMSGLGAGVNTYKGNQAAKKSQDPALMLKNATLNNSSYNPRMDAGATLQFMGSHPGAAGSSLGAGTLAQGMVNSGATLTSSQAKALNPYEKQSLQGSIAPGFMESFMKQLTPEMISSLFQLMGNGDKTTPTEGQ